MREAASGRQHQGGSIREAASGRHRRASLLQLPVSPSVGSSAMPPALKHASAPCCMRVARCTRDASRSNPSRIHRLLQLLQWLALQFCAKACHVITLLVYLSASKKGGGSETDKRG
jgi:hypothetical protein